MDVLEQEQSGELKTFAGPWVRKGQELLLVCGKCQKKMRRGKDAAGLGKLKKALRTRAKKSGLDVELKLLTVSCLKVCPKGGVVACTAEMVGAGRVSILRDSTGVDALLGKIGNGGDGLAMDRGSLTSSGHQTNGFEGRNERT